MTRKSHETGKNSHGTSETLRVVIDTPQRSRNKFKHEPETGSYKLSKILPEGMVFPYDFGFVPHTRGEDGDPVDVLVLVEEPTFPGCIVECRLIGVIEAEQRKGNEKPTRNDRLVGVARASSLYAGVADIGQLQSTVLKDIEGFFVNYDRLRGVEFKVLRHSGPGRAYEILANAEKHEDKGSERPRHRRAS
jgi:inorganic pyrophosphatase